MEKIDAVHPLTYNLSDENERIRSEMRCANGIFFKQDIKRMEKERDIVGLVKALTSEYRYIPWQAAEALGRIGDDRAIQPLHQALEHRYSQVREAAKEALDRIQARRS